MEYSGVDNLEVMSAALNYNAFLLKLVLQQAEGSKTLLDFGAGLGEFAKKIKGHGYDVKCFEVDPGLCERLSRSGFTVYSSENAVPKHSIDQVYTMNVLEHLEEDEKVLRHFHDWIRPGGKLLVYVPAIMHLYTSMDEKVGHVRRYGRRELMEKAERAGFQNIECRFVDSLGYLATLAYKMIGSSDGSISERSVRFYDRILFPLSRVIDRGTGKIGGKNLLLLADKS